MTPAAINGLIWLAALVVVGIVWAAARRGRRRGGTLTGAVAGTMYDWQNEEKQKALEIIVEGRAEARDPESADGNLPDLESPEKRR